MHANLHTTHLLAIYVCLLAELSGVFHESSDCRFGLRRVEFLYKIGSN